jgi:hypothetical protein
MEQADKADPIVLSDDPNWPDTQIIQGRAHEPSASELAELEEDMKDIRHWLREFLIEDKCWTSKFDMHAYYAQCDIDIANQKIVALQKIIRKQKSFIQEAELIIKKHKRHEAAMRASNKIGRPEKATKRQEIAIKFTSQWVQSLIETLNVDNCVQLETIVKESNQRNWRRWLRGDAVPTHTNLSALLNSEIKQGIYKDKPLHVVPTNPEGNDLLKLISLT